jgi:tetratricopeptide (TPR) repeat protein
MNNFLRFFCFFVLMTSFVVDVPAQMKLADEYFKDLEYSKAVPCYEKALKKKKDPAAASNLAFCYTILKDYPKAEAWYAKVVADSLADPRNFICYGKILRINNKSEEAQKQFENYLSRFPGDKEALLQLQACQEMKIWLVRVPGFAVSNVRELNTKYSEFSPCYYKNGLALTSDRANLDLIEEDNNRATSRAFLSVYFAEFRQQAGDSISFKTPVPLEIGLNSVYHNGPVSFSDDQKMIAFTRVGKENKLSALHFVNHPKIYFSYSENKKFKNIVPFPYNSDSYSVTQPALSGDGKTLYFTSDMPGGFGGKDLYLSHKQGDSTWSKPENLGPEVNTSQDESFPYFYKDSSLYFSSTGHPGYGGMDLFSASLSKGSWTHITNLGSPINGSSDDFGIVFDSEKKHGFFTSDRSGGRGNDDIYSFRVIKKIIKVAGRILFSPDTIDPAKGVIVRILTDKGEVLNVGTTNDKGFFLFENLPPDAKYTVALDENDPALKGRDRAWMAEENGRVIRVIVFKDGKRNSFEFRNLPADPNAAPDLYDTNDLLNLAGNILAGSKNPLPITPHRVVVRNDKGEVIQTTQTNERGGFAFRGLPPEQNLTIALDDNETPLLPDLLITITDRNGIVVGTARTDAHGRFHYQILAASHARLKELPVVETELKVDMKGKLLAGDGSNKALVNTTIRTLDEKGNELQRTKTDANGFFKFENLPSAANYAVAIGDTNDPQLSDLDKLFLADVNGNVINELKITKTPNGSVVQLKNEELTMTLNGRLIEGTDTSKPVSFISLYIKTDKGIIVQTIKTDRNGSFEFKDLPADHKYVLSIADGRDPKLRNVDKIFLCNSHGKILRELPFDKGHLGTLEVEDQDLRVDLKGRLQSADSTHKMIANVTVHILNQKGQLVQTIKTDDKGNFLFKSLPSDENYMISIDPGDDPVLAALSLIEITDEKGAVFQQLKKEADGTFDFGILPADQSKMGLVYLEDTPLAARTEHPDSLVTPESRKPQSEHLKAMASILDASVNDKKSANAARKVEISNMFIKYGDVKVEELEFKVQIGAYNLPDGFNYTDVLKFGEVQKNKSEDAITRFTIGHCGTLNEAGALKAKVVGSGIKDAFVTALYKNKRILLEDLISSGVFTVK